MRSKSVMKLAKKVAMVGVMAVFGVVLVPVFEARAVINDGIEGSGQGFELAVSPGYMEVDLVPGTVTSETFRVRNAGTEEADILIGVRPLEFSGDTAALGTPRNEIVDWTSIALQKGCNATDVDSDTGDITIHMRVREECFVNFATKTPMDAPFGEQYMNVFFQEYKEESGSGMQVIRSISAGVYGTNKIGGGSSDACGKVSEQSIPFWLLGGTLETMAMVENCGQLNFHATIAIEVRNVFGVLVYEEAQANDKIIPANAERALRDTWEETGIGVYRVRQTVEALGETYVVESLTFVVPVWLIAVIVLAVVIVIFAIVHDRRKKRSQGLRR